MPDAAEVVLLVLELLHLDHLGESGDALDEGILDRPAHGASERHELRRVELLVAEENDLVLQERLSNLRCREIPRKVDAEDLGAERSGDAPDLQAYCSTLMFASRMMMP
jgi:hypothetical protein